MANRRLLDRSRRNKWWQRSAGQVAVVVVFAAAGLTWWVLGGDDESEGPPPTQTAIAEAGGDVTAGVAAAREALDGQRAEAIMDEVRERRARQTDYTPGESELLIGELEARESVYVSMTSRGIPDASVHRVVQATDEEFDFRRSRAGDIWRAEIDEEGRIEEFQYETSPEDIWVTRRDEESGEYVTDKKDVELEVRHTEVAGEVDGSFWLSVTRDGASDLLAHRFMEVFRYTLDFNTETRDGDRYAMVVERLFLDDEFLRYGRVVSAVYIGERGPIQAYYFEGDDEENTGYFDETGESLERQFLRSPLEVSRVTSGFGRREHPITGDERMHHGVDYGAPTGTPVQAVADGTVTFAGWQGGYGNLLKIRHAGGYQTRYAHLSSFASGISPGVQVSQGEVVARSGNTGASTAPHLHYEMLRDGRHIDPLQVDASSGEPLDEGLIDEFREEVVEPKSERLHALLAEEAPEAAEVFAESTGE